MGLPFTECAACGHGVVGTCRVPRCRLCGGPLRAREAPRDLLAGWRCACAACVAVVC